MTSLQLILDAFLKYYGSLGRSVNELLSEDEWSDHWFDFKKVESFKTFIPYLFCAGLMPKETWAIYQYQENKDISFSELDKLANKDQLWAVMDWSETALEQPHWRGSKSHKHLVKKGATLNEFLNSIIDEFEGRYVEAANTKKYWVDYVCMDEKDIDNLFIYMYSL